MRPLCHFFPLENSPTRGHGHHGHHHCQNFFFSQNAPDPSSHGTLGLHLGHLSVPPNLSHSSPLSSHPSHTSTTCPKARGVQTSLTLLGELNTVLQKVTHWNLRASSVEDQFNRVQTSRGALQAPSQRRTPGAACPSGPRRRGGLTPDTQHLARSPGRTQRRPQVVFKFCLFVCLN